MRAVLLALSALFAFGTPQEISTQPPAACTFTLSRRAPATTLTGPTDIVQRVRLPLQADSPLAITALDLTETNLVVGPGSYERSGRSTLDVMNVSDRPVSGFRAEIRVSHGSGGTGRGGRFSGILQPGERTRIIGGGGRGAGSGHFAAEDMVIHAFIAEVSFETCKYRPSLSEPRPY